MGLVRNNVEWLEPCLVGDVLTNSYCETGDGEVFENHRKLYVAFMVFEYVYDRVDAS